MTRKLTWNEKADLVFIHSSVSVKQIQKLLDIGQPSAIRLRELTLKLAETEGRWVAEKKVPIDLLLRVVGLNMDYFVDMATKERNSKQKNRGV